jgi:hypothetical protein
MTGLIGNTPTFLIGAYPNHFLSLYRDNLPLMPPSVIKANFDEFPVLDVGTKLVIDTRQDDRVFLLDISKIIELRHNSNINFDNPDFGITDCNEYYSYFGREVLDNRHELIENRSHILGDNPFEVRPFDNTYQSDMSKNIGIVLECIDNLSEINPDLDEYSSLPPDNECITNAKGIAIDLITEIYSNNLRWIDPYISSDEEGCILIELYDDDRQLHIEINDADAEYITFFRTDTYSEMHDGNFNPKNYMLHWKWLVNEQ